MKTTFVVAAAAALMVLGPAAQAQVTVQDAWVRGTVATQKATGAFMTLTSPTAAKLVEVRSPVAGVAEVHEMAHQDGVMRMRAVTGGLPLPAGQAVKLEPGGYHVMLMDLKQPVKAGETVPLTLVIEGADRQRQTVEVKAEVRALGGQAPGPVEHRHKH